MRASQRGNALFRAGTQPLRQPRAPTSRHPPLEIEPSQRVKQRRYSWRLRRGPAARASEHQCVECAGIIRLQESWASFGMASGAISAGEFGTLLWDASNIRIQRRVAEHGGIG